LQGGRVTAVRRVAGDRIVEIDVDALDELGEARTRTLVTEIMGRHSNIILRDADDRVIGLIDWESAGVQHPLSDFDFGEWGFGIFAWESDFLRLRKTFWESYAEARGADLPDWRAVGLLMTIIGAPPPEGLATDWDRRRRDLTVTNMQQIDALA
jgi:hypothetical protein